MSHLLEWFKSLPGGEIVRAQRKGRRDNGNREHFPRLHLPCTAFGPAWDMGEHVVEFECGTTLTVFRVWRSCGGTAIENPIEL